tara:strand:+ start:845 stop:1003 length:159 start_codon:yes stop_codon:yes gene_type:complete
MSKVEKLNRKIRALGFELARAQSRGMRCDDFFGKKLAHSLLLKELYSIEKKV